jgi:diaminopimelate decarboxylase
VTVEYLRIQAPEDEAIPGIPAWLNFPQDINELRPNLWSRTVRQGEDGVLRVGGVDIISLAKEFGTPAYLFDEADFRMRCAEFRTFFHDFDVFYAGKAFLCKTSVRLVEQAGLSLDVCTGGELTVALTAGFPPERILMHGNNKSEDELQRALESGVSRIVVDSFEEIDRLEILARLQQKHPRLLVRITVGVMANTHEYIATAHDDQKFGFSLANGAAAKAVHRILDSEVLELCGLHSHIGSQILGVAAFEEAARRLLKFRAEIAEEGTELPELNLGGGFGIAYTDADKPTDPQTLAETLRTVVAKKCASLGVSVPRLAIEPGRAIAGPSGCTLYRVGAVKRINGVRTYVTVDGGMSDNVRTALYDGIYSVKLASRASSAEPMLSRVVGKHCDAGDIVVRDDFLPADVRAGDLLAVPGTGAYCRSLSLNYNHVPRPPVIAVSNGQTRMIIRRETENDMLRLDMG